MSVRTPVRARRVQPLQRRYARALGANPIVDAVLSDEALPDLDPDSDPWPGEQIEIDGGQVFVRRTPPTRTGLEPALMVHGLGGSSLNWTDLAQQLSGHLDVHAIDLPGFGRSRPNVRHDYRVTAFAETVIGYVEASGRGPVHLIGNSMGGATALEVAARRPDLVRTLTLISPAVPDTKLRVYPLRFNPRMAVLAVPGLAIPAVRRTSSRIAPEALARGTLKLCFGDTSRYPATRLEQDVEFARERIDLPWAAEALVKSGRDLALSGLAGRSIWARYASVRTPTLIVWGTRDRLVSPEMAPVLAGALPEARLLMLDGVGHVAMMEDPVTTTRAVLGLIESVEE